MYALIYKFTRKTSRIYNRIHNPGTVVDLTTRQENKEFGANTSPFRRIYDFQFRQNCRFSTVFNMLQYCHLFFTFSLVWKRTAFRNICLISVRKVQSEAI